MGAARPEGRTERNRHEVRSKLSTDRVLKAALALFSRQGFRATTMRQIARRSGRSVGNLYHHFGGKEVIFQQLLDQYWQRLLDPTLRLNRLFYAATFPEDLEQLADAIDEVVQANADYILLIYIDVIEFRGKHIRAFYEGMAPRFAEAYLERLEARKRAGELGEPDPMVAVMLATRWFFYYFTVERCFGVPMHFGMKPDQAVHEFIRILRYGILARGGEGSLPAAVWGDATTKGETRPGRRS
jgi:AcrR family transcriptional regulator